MNAQKQSVWAVMFAVFCGVICGWVVGQQLNTHLAFGWGWLAWVGCVVSGGLIGYVFVDPWGFCVQAPAAARLAWNECREQLTPSSMTRARYRFLWSNKGELLLLLAINLSWWGLFVAFLYIESGSKQRGELVEVVTVIIGFIVILGVLFHTIFCIMVLQELLQLLTVDQVSLIQFGINNGEKKLGELRESRKFNPPYVLFYFLPRLLLEVIWENAVKCWGFVLRSPWLFWLVVRFCWHTYKLTHTSARLIAMADAALFCGVVYFTNSLGWAAVIALSGALWGAVNVVVIAPRLVPLVDPLLISKK